MILTKIAIAVLAATILIHDPARPDLNGWFDKLISRNGPCCSNADGQVLIDSDWDSKDGHYRVRIEDQWWNVPDDALIKEPNLDGRTIVWPVYYRTYGYPTRIVIRCFMPGSMG